MKYKKFAVAVAALLGATSLAACTDSNKQISFDDYWKKKVLSGEKVNESLQYAVTFERGSGAALMDYTLSYGEGSYETLLKSRDITTEYEYTTKLTVPVSYQFGEEKAEFVDEVTTHVIFMNSDKGLRPISSVKTVKSHTPSNSAVTELSKAYISYDYTVTTTYADNGTGSGTGSSVVVHNPSSETPEVSPAYTFTYGNGDYSFLDNEQLLLSLRAVPAGTTSGVVEIANPFLKAIQRVSFSFAEQATYKYSYTLNGTETQQDIAYRPVSFQLKSNSPGATQTAQIAALTDPENNVHRNVMLRLETPLSYNLGKLVYTLKAVDRE